MSGSEPWSASVGGPHANGAGSRTAALCLVGLVVIGLVAVPLAIAHRAGSPARPTAAVGDTALLQAEGPTATLSIAPDRIHPGDPVTIDATGSTAGANESIERCAFDGDGDGAFETTTQSCRLERPYGAVGNYTVTVRVVTTADRTATASGFLAVRENEVPRPAIAVDPPTPRPGDRVVLSATDTADPDGEVVAHEWSVDGRTLAGASVAVEFDAGGEHEVTLLVTDDDGADASTTAVVDVAANRPPTADLHAEPADPTVGESVTLDATGSTDSDGAVVAYRWDLDGDGAVDRRTTAPRTTVVVGAGGTRAVGVTVVDDRGWTAGATVEVTVAAVETTADGVAGSETRTGKPAGASLSDRLDPGLVPVVPDWLVVVMLGAVVGGVLGHRREPVPARVRRLRERLHSGEFRRNLAEKATGLLTKSAFKKLFRTLADGVEASGTAVGEAVERAGRAIKRASERLADVLRRIGG